MIKINYKYLNILLLLGNCYLLFLLKNVWLEAVLKIFDILFPFILGFSLAYIFYPLVRIINKKIPKIFSVIIIIIIILFIMIITLYYTLPILFSSINNLFCIIQKELISIGIKYNIDIRIILNIISKHSNKIIGFFIETNKLNSFMNGIGKSAKYITSSVMTIVSFLYFLFNMDNIRKKIKVIIKGRRIFKVIKEIDEELTSYLKGFLIFACIQFIEYTLVFLLIGHPNYLLIGFLASITGVIPYFGAIITNIVALVLATNISKELFIITVIILVIFPNIDEYIISPKIYKKTNKISPLLQIFSVFLFGSLFGFFGVIISVPLIIIVGIIIREYKDSIIKRIKKQK